MSKIYLSSGFFTDESIKKVKEVAQLLREIGHKVYVPMEYFVPGGENMPQEEWARKVFQKDVEEMNKCDEIIMLDFGANGDCGAAWEGGYAYAKGIPYTVFCYGSDVSLMVYCGASNTQLVSVEPEKLKLV